ncbi:hypothetical protein JOB18_036345 [Solea senegalensis]|uniref:SGNH hydrolase-type esterase domain-containing protein n=1 Tax=Solea senegalensis TaxID=28829 RepID=A0AAV6PIW2_SOLSE|nr:hypothetical protein JOB18_036345 [Solea senegalensis]
MRRVTRHVSTMRKMKEWGLNVRRKNLIIGDSNLCRFPAFREQHLQIDCYPGANFRHAGAIISKATCTTQPEKIILAFGLNHRSQRLPPTSVKQLQAALRATKLRFPDARVMVPIINFSPSLPQQERFALQALNRYIFENCESIETIQRDKFSTGPDNVHWSKETARAILSHWCEALN